MLSSLDPSSEWFLSVAFVCSNQKNFSHNTTTGSGFGIDLEVVFFVWALYLLSLVAFFNSSQKYSFHATTIRIWIGIDLEIVFLIWVPYSRLTLDS